MNSKIKDYLGIALIFALVITGFSAWELVKTYSKSIDPSSLRKFSVMSEGKATAVPDVAQFSFSVIIEGGKDIVKLQKENTEKVNKIIFFIKNQKIEAKDIKTESYNLEPRYQYFSCPRAGGVCPPPEIVGYTISQNVSVKIRDFNKIGDILAGAVKNGANTVSDLRFTVDDPAQVQNQARAEAIEKAKIKAMAIAKAGGFKLGQLLAIEENEGGDFYKYDRSVLGMGGGLEVAPAPAIEPGSQEVLISIRLTYGIK